MRRASIAPGTLAALLVAACGVPLTVDGVTLLRYGPQPAQPVALGGGTLRFLDGCVIIENEDAGGATFGTTVLWPMGTDLRRIDGRLAVVVDGVAGFDGDQVEMGGGEYTDQEFVESLVGPVGRCISDRYWMATSLEVLDRT